ncbi:thioredoxin 1 [Penicillium sp. IBT 35674x]|nr:thioredoxin 1 [Penicillium sp. IBT 35674x]
MAVIEIKSKAEFDELVQSRPAVAIHAHAEWSGPSKFMLPKFDMYAQDDVSKVVTFARFISENSSDIIGDLYLPIMPTFFFYKDGKQLGTVYGPDQSENRGSASSCIVYLKEVSAHSLIGRACGIDFAHRYGDYCGRIQAEHE